MKLYKRRKVKGKKRKNLTHKFLSLFILTVLFYQSSVAYAVEDNILGVPLEKFNGITDSSSRLQSTLEFYDKNEESIGYQLKYKLDSYRYMYEILNVAEQLGENKVNVIPDHVANYNKLLTFPLTEEDQIVATLNSDDDYEITTKSSDALVKLSTLAGSEGKLVNDKGEPLATFTAELGRIREAVGMSATLGADDTIDESEKPDALEYIESNISNIRYLFTALKEYIVEYDTELSGVDFPTLEKYFISTYDEVMGVSIEEEVDGLKDLDLWGQTGKVNLEAEGEELLAQIGEWEELELSEEDEAKDNPEDRALKLNSYSEYMLKGISASATYRPFETNLNSTEALSFLGDESSAFHEMHGTTRKIVLTVSDTYNNLNNALNLRSVKDIKMMTLRQFVENPDEPKVLYVDNFQYNLTEVENAQEAVEEAVETEEEEGDSGELEEAQETTEEESGTDEGGNWFTKASTKVGNTIAEGVLWINNSNPLLDKLILDTNYHSTPEKIETLIFASGKPSDLGNHEKELSKVKSKVNLGYLVYRNIIEEYWGMSTKLKMHNDLDKPLYVDTYGNILSASGIVIIPAVSNPFYYKDSEPAMLFNRAVFEAYPEYTSKDGRLEVASGDKNKVALYFTASESTEGEELVDANVESEIEEAKARMEEALGKQEEDGEGGQVGEETSGNLLETDIPVIPGVSLRVGNAEKGEPTADDSVGIIEPLAYKFDNEYNSLKSLDIWSFPQIDSYTIDSYYAINPLSERLPKGSNVALMDDYTVKLTYQGTDSSEVITFKDVPNSDELKRFIYITNLENIVSIEDGEILDKGILSDHIYAVTKQVFLNGIKDTNTINSLVPDIVQSMFNVYQQFLLEQANSRYDKALGDSKDNNLIYAKSLEEIDALKSVLPMIYKVILLVSIVAIILNIILTVIIQESRLKQLLKVFTVMYLVTFILNASSWIFETGINGPTRWMFNKETIFWTVIEQEKLANKKELATEDEIVEIEDDYGSQIKLYKIPYNYPYKMLTSSETSGAITIDEFYEHYLNNEGIFRAQNNEMYVDGNYLVVDTKTVFDSSSIITKDAEKDIFLKLEHEIYNNPELAFYMPYYMFIDNIVYNLNTLTDLNTKIPTDITYANGTVKTTGRIYDYINSAIFLDYSEYLERIAEYESSDKISAELSIAEIKNITAQYGENNDFLGIRKILGLASDDELAPFTRDGLDNIQNTGWYPDLEGETINQGQRDELERKALKVNDKVKMFMMSLGELSENVADEHLIKTIALYASFEFNKEFNEYAVNTGPTGIELSNVPLERLLMGLSLPREELIDSSVATYPNKVLEEEGYLGLILSTANDWIILGINHIKPSLVVFVWSLTAIVVFVRKVIIPDPSNRSILGSLKIIAVYVATSLGYAGGLSIAIKMINWTNSMLVSQILMLVLNLAYLGAIVFLIYAMLKDIWNLGNSVILKGLEGSLKGFAGAVTGAVSSVPIVDKYFGKYFDNKMEGARHLGRYFEQKSIKSSDNIGTTGLFEPVDLSIKAMDKARGVTNKIRNKGQSDNYSSGGYNSNNPDYVDLPDGYGSSRRNRSDNDDDSIINLQTDTFEQSSSGKPRRTKEEDNGGKIYDVYSDKFNSNSQSEPVKPTYNKEDEVDYLNNRTENKNI